MSIELIVCAVLLPLVFWAAYHYYHDRHRPEPVRNLLIALFLGGLASLLAGLGYRLLDLAGLSIDVAALASTNLPGLLVYSVLGIGLIEEAAKLLPFLLVVLRFRDFDEPLDGVLYASFIALGFAIVENFHFFAHVSWSEAMARGFAGPLLHMVFASIWAHPIGTARLRNGRLMVPTLAGLSLSVLLHGAYDFVVLAFSDRALILASLLIVGGWLWRLRLFWRLAATGPEADR